MKRKLMNNKKRNGKKNKEELKKKKEDKYNYRNNYNTVTINNITTKTNG